MKIAVVLGSVREGRVSPLVGEKILEEGRQHPEAEFELIDLKEFNLPIMPKRLSDYDGSEPEYPQLKAIQQKLDEADGYIFVVQEYNHAITASLKTIFEYFYTEYNNKAAGIVSYGIDGGVRAAEQLRQIAAEVRIADVRTHVTMNIFNEFKNFTEFTPLPFNIKRLHTQIDEIIEWSTALKPLREAKKTVLMK